MASEMVSKAVLQSLRIAGTFLHALALITTGFRAGHRWRRGKFFWDDIWAVVAATLDAILLITLWVRARTRDRAAAGHPIPFEQGRMMHLLTSLTFPCVLWAARTSIACSILRLLPPGRTKKFVIWMMGWFFLMWLLLLIQKSWICGKDKTWRDDCLTGKPFVLVKLCSDIIANVLLVAVPVYMLWDSTLPKGPRWMIRVVFATSITTTAISVMHAVHVMGPNRVLEGYTAHFEAAVTVTICNLLVVVTCCYRAVRNGHDLDEELSEYLSSRQQAPLTDMSFTEISTQSPGSSMMSYGQGTSLFRNQSAMSSVANDTGVSNVVGSSKEHVPPSP